MVMAADEFQIPVNATRESFVCLQCFDAVSWGIWPVKVPYQPYQLLQTVYTVLHGMQKRSSDENSVCLSVCQTRGL